MRRVMKCSSSKFLHTSSSSGRSSSATSSKPFRTFSQKQSMHLYTKGPTFSSSTMRKMMFLMTMLLRKTQSSMVDQVRKRDKNSFRADIFSSSRRIYSSRFWLSFTNSQISGVFLTSDMSTLQQYPSRVGSPSSLLIFANSRCRQRQTASSLPSLFWMRRRQAMPIDSISDTRQGQRQHSRSLHSRMFCGTDSRSMNRSRNCGFSAITVSRLKAQGVSMSSVRVGMLFLSFINISESMLNILTAYIKLFHIGLISFVCFQICTPDPEISLELFFLELALTTVNILISKKHFLDVFQIVLTLNLSYCFFPNNYTFVTGLYFLKIIFVFNAFGEAVDDLFESASNSLTRILKFVVSILRYTLVEYLYLGLVMLGYKIFTLGDTEGSLPEDYVILYKLIVTATTIGYGDVTPKTKLQMYYFTYAIPFICASFVVYFNAVIPIIGELIDFLTGNATLQTEEGCHEGEVLRSKIWSAPERDSFVNFIEEVSKRQAEHEEHSKRLGHNWIAVSANHYERQIPLISSILQGDEGKELKLKVSNKVRRQYYPKGWTILQAGDISDDLMMVDEGEVKTPAVQKKGFVFNKDGFLSRTPSRDTIVASEFVAVWAISMQDLQDLAKTSSKIQSIITEGIRL